LDGDVQSVTWRKDCSKEQSGSVTEVQEWSGAHAQC
jgi:hypothetical protein